MRYTEFVLIYTIVALLQGGILILRIVSPSSGRVFGSISPSKQGVTKKHKITPKKA
jgi:hypothetical protein